MSNYDEVNHDLNHHEASSWRGDQTGLQLLKMLQTQHGIAIVGTREADSLGLEWTKRIVKVAVNHHLIIISGGARGIDEQAHIATREYGGESISILGCGLGKMNSRHHQLANQGVGLLSIFPHEMSSRKWTFPRRNKAIADLSEIIIVTQATAKSGTLSTAREALRLNKPVWVLPHLPNKILHQGCLTLLKEGAYPLTDEHCWLESLPTDQKKLIDQNQHSFSNAPSKSIESDLILPQHPSQLWQVTSTEPRSLEQLALDAKISFSEALSEATILELTGWLTPILGGFYVRAYGTL